MNSTRPRQSQHQQKYEGLDTGLYPPASTDSAAISLHLFDSIQRIRQSLDFEDVLQATVTEVRRLLQVERVFVFQFEPDWSGRVIIEDCAPHCLALQGQSIYDPCFAECWVEAYQQGRVQVVDDIYTAGLTPCHIQLLETLAVRANLVVPLQANGALWGLLVAQHCTAPRCWQTEELQVLQQLAQQVGAAIQQSELYRRAQAELAEYKQTEAKLQQQAQRSQDRYLESLGTLAGGIAQDLGDILTPIFLAAEMLNQPSLQPKQQQWLQRIKTSAYQSNSLLDQLLSFVQGMKGQRADIQLAYVLGELVQTLRETQPKTIQIVSELRRPYLWTVEGVATQLHQVFMNLCQNACEAISDGGQLHISAQNCWWRGDSAYPQAAPGPYVVVSIQDSGAGMAPDVRDRSCEPFFTTRAQQNHSGLGLSTALGLVKSHNGWMTIRSELGIGTTVDVYLPATVASPYLAAAPTHATGMYEGHGSPVLLVMTDEPRREWLRAVLTSYRYPVLLAETGTDAIALFIQHQSELTAVVLDITLPTLNGDTILQRMHQMNADVPVIVADEQPQPNSAISILTKPIAADALLQTLATVAGMPTLDISG